MNQEHEKKETAQDERIDKLFGYTLGHGDRLAKMGKRGLAVDESLAKLRTDLSDAIERNSAVGMRVQKLEKVERTVEVEEHDDRIQKLEELIESQGERLAAVELNPLLAGVDNPVAEAEPSPMRTILQDIDQLRRRVIAAFERDSGRVRGSSGGEGGGIEYY